jgi:hypothetical protein
MKHTRRFLKSKRYLLIAVENEAYAWRLKEIRTATRLLMSSIAQVPIVVYVTREQFSALQAAAMVSAPDESATILRVCREIGIPMNLGNIELIVDDEKVREQSLIKWPYRTVYPRSIADACLGVERDPITYRDSAGEMWSFDGVERKRLCEEVAP